MQTSPLSLTYFAEPCIFVTIKKWFHKMDLVCDLFLLQFVLGHPLSEHRIPSLQRLIVSCAVNLVVWSVW